MIRFNTLKRRSTSVLAAAAVTGALLVGVAGAAPASAARLYPPGPSSPATAASPANDAWPVSLEIGEAVQDGVIIQE
jgi:hypothetical protein